MLRAVRRRPQGCHLPRAANLATVTVRWTWRALLLMTLVVGHVGCASSLGDGRYANQALASTVRIDRLVVHKSEQRMDAFFENELLKQYRVQTGYASGPKRWEGDQRTPEGDYVIDTRYPSQRFGYFLHVSYPNRVDRERYQQLLRDGAVPSGATVGSAIGIHGESDETAGQIAASLGMNWTAGCIAVSNEEIAELFRAVAPGARLTILP